MEIIGLRPSSFTTKDGEKIEGMTMYLAEVMHGSGAEGKSAERVFLSQQKLANLDFVPRVGMEVNVLYNKYGKVAAMMLVDPVDDLLIED